MSRPATQIKEIAQQGLKALEGRKRVTSNLSSLLHEYFTDIEKLATDLDARSGTNEAAAPST